MDRAGIVEGVENGAGIGLGDGGLELGLDVVGIRERMNVGCDLEGIYVGVVVGFGVEVGEEVGKGWLG